ncbi:MAG: alpha/beta hydrolase-fold protein [candidate division KSB1 bacterium]|nr:alpha/beta hydrolase-fold protein [candidate division KSB1 bacterium]
MPRYKRAEETIPRSDIPTGTLVDSTWYSRSLQKRRIVQLYFPAAFERLSGDVPLVLFLDGKDFIHSGSAKVILDNLIAFGKIPPLIAVFDSPFDRISEYAGPSMDALDAYIVSELLPRITHLTKVSNNPAQRAIIGVSLSAVFASRFVQRHPDQFGCCAAFSPAYWYDDHRVFSEIKQGEIASIRFYLDRGLFESDSIAWADSMKYVLEQKGASVRWRVWPEGHSWGSWKAHLDEALVYFFAETK